MLMHNVIKLSASLDELLRSQKTELNRILSSLGPTIKISKN